MFSTYIIIALLTKLLDALTRAPQTFCELKEQVLSFQMVVSSWKLHHLMRFPDKDIYWEYLSK